MTAVTAEPLPQRYQPSVEPDFLGAETVQPVLLVNLACLEHPGNTLQVFLDVLRREQFILPAANDGTRIAANGGGGAAIGIEHLAGAVEDEDHVGGGFGEMPIALLALPQGFFRLFAAGQIDVDAEIPYRSSLS